VKIRPLLNRRPLEPGESLPSLLVRLQIANYYNSPGALTQICRPHLPANETLHLPRLAETWPVLAAVTRLPAAELYQASFHRYADTLVLPWETVQSVTLPDGEQASLLTPRMRHLFLRSLQDVQYCPVCLVDGRYHRLRWLNFLVAVCSKHECLLQYGCPDCRQKVPISAIIVGRCSACSYDLTTTAPISVSHDSWGMWVQRQLQSWWGDVSPPALPDQITVPNCAEMILLELLRGLAAAAAKLPEEMHYPTPCSGLADVPLPPSQFPTPVQVYCTYAMAMNIVAYWPQAFHRFLDVYRQRPGVTVGQITNELYPLYAPWLEEQWQQPEFAFVQDAFDDFLVTHYPVSRSLTRLDRYRRNQAFRDRFTYLTQAEAAERLGVEPEIAQRLVDVEMLVDYERGEGQQRHWHERLRIVRRTEFVDLQARWQAGIPFADVVRLLEVDQQVVENLVGAGLLVKYQVINDVGDVLGQIETTSLNTFVRNLHRYPATPYDFGEPISLRELVEDGYDLIKVVQQGVAKKVKTMWHGGGLYDLWLSQVDVHRLEK
jgi:hypothetical protein